MLGSLILYLKGMRIMMFQLSGFYYNPNPKQLQVTPNAKQAKLLRADLQHLQGTEETPLQALLNPAALTESGTSFHRPRRGPGAVSGDQDLATWASSEEGFGV